MSRGRRFDDEPKLNIKKVIATVIALIVIIMVIVSIVALFNKKEVVQVNEPVEYFSYNTNNKWGVINSKGEVVIDASYDEMIVVPDKTKDIFIYNYDVDYENETYKTKVINSKGEELFTNYSNVEPLDNYTSTEDIWYDTNSLRFNQDGKYGLIDYSGNQILPPEYDDIYTLKGLERSIILEKDGKYGLYNDMTKDLILDVQYSEIKALGDIYDDGYIVKNSENKYGLILPDKNTVLNFNYDNITDVHDGTQYLVENDDKKFVVDNTESVILELDDNEDIIEINEDEYVLLKDNKFNIINSEKKELLDKTYDYLEHAYGDYYIAGEDNKYGIIDSSGNVVVDLKYVNVTYRADAAFFECENEDYTTDIYDNTCEYKVTGTISEVNIDNSYIRIRVGDDYKYYNLLFEEKSNKDVLSNNTLFLVKENGKYGYENKEGERVVDCIYDDAQEQNAYGFCAVQKDGKWGALKSDGAIVLEPTIDLSDNIIIDFIGKYHLDKNIELNSYTE